MFLKKLLITSGFILSSKFAWASSDNACAPNWTLIQNTYNRCSNVPFLSPGNDTKVNLKLLLIDNGLARMEEAPVSKEDAESGYGKVPFSLERFEYSLFKDKTATDNPTGTTRIYHGSGTRCISNDEGQADFIEAVRLSSNLSADEQKQLIDARQKLSPSCPDLPATKGSADPSASQAEASTAFLQFQLYIEAATAFYDGRYSKAATGFAELFNSEQPWLKEASFYMLGRAALNKAQQNAFDSFGMSDLTNVDQKTLKSAEVTLSEYLKAYPDGRYCASARGLLRRIYWLSDQTQKLADEYAWLLEHPDSPQQNLSLSSLALEADNKLFGSTTPAQIKNPLLLATLDLALMRSASPSDKKQFRFAELMTQQPVFVKHQALFNYLVAVHYFYVQKDPAAALKILSGRILPKMSYLDFSRLVLRGLALEALKDHAGARKLWIDLLSVSGVPLQSETLQLALAINYEQSNLLEAVFKADSVITEPAIRNIIIRNNASAGLLRRIIQAGHTTVRERNEAVFTLLYKDLLQGHYRDYLSDYHFLPAGTAQLKPSAGTNQDDSAKLSLFNWAGIKTDDSYSCVSTTDIAKRLSKEPADPHGLACLGDFANSNSLEPGYQPQRPQAVIGAPLGSAPSQFSGKVFSRGEAYKSIMDNPDTPPDLKAYALFRAIKCYATSGYNHCGGENVEKSVRKSWFQTLKTRYSNTSWAQSLKYYW